jgi:hypothetical protein
VEMKSIINVWIADMKDDRRETMSCQVMEAWLDSEELNPEDMKSKVACQVMEAWLDSEELNPEDMKSKVEHQEVSTEEAAMISSGTMKKRHRGWH